MNALMRVTAMNLVIVCLLVIAAGCGGAPAPTIDVTGLWSVSYAGHLPPASELTLTQIENKVTGTFKDHDGFGGMIEGKVSGNTIKYLHTGYPMDYRIKAECTINGSSMSGKWSDTRNDGGAQSGVRQWGP